MPKIHKSFIISAYNLCARVASRAGFVKPSPQVLHTGRCHGAMWMCMYCSICAGTPSLVPLIDSYSADHIDDIMSFSGVKFKRKNCETLTHANVNVGDRGDRTVVLLQMP
jgi:hypothetical protein